MKQPYEIYMALRYLSAHGNSWFISFISFVSISGICLSVAVLIIVLSVMNGFESEINKRIVNVETNITIKRTNPIDYNTMEDLELSFIEGKKVVFPSLESKGIMEFN